MNQVILKTNATHKDKLQTYRKTFTFTVFGYKILGRDIIHTWIIGHTHLHAALVNTGTIISANLQKQDQLTQLSFCFWRTLIRSKSILWISNSPCTWKSSSSLGAILREIENTPARRTNLISQIGFSFSVSIFSLQFRSKFKLHREWEQHMPVHFSLALTFCEAVVKRTVGTKCRLWNFKSLPSNNFQVSVIIEKPKQRMQSYGEFCIFIYVLALPKCPLQFMARGKVIRVWKMRCNSKKKVTCRRQCVLFSPVNS